MGTFLRNTISKLDNALSAPVAATQDAFAERLQTVRKTASLLYNTIMENMEYGQGILKDAVEKEAEGGQQQEPAATKEQQQDDAVPKINLGYKGRRVKEFRVSGNLNNVNTRMIIDNITLHIEMRVKVIYSFKAEIHRGAGEIMDYSKTLTSPTGMFTSLEEIQAYIEECEKKRLDLDNEEVWSKAYFPHERTTETRSNNEDKVIFKHHCQIS